MKRAFFMGAFLLVLGSAHADLVFKSPSIEVRLSDRACVSAKVLEHLKPEYHARFRQGWVRWQGRDYEACWVIDSGHAFVMDEAGDSGGIPLSALKREDGV